MAGMYYSDLPQKKQDVLDKVWNVESDKTPYMKLVKKGKQMLSMLSNSPVFDYNRSSLKGVVDGEDVKNFNKTDRALLEFYGQLVRESWFVGILANIMHTPELDNKEKAWQKAQALVTLKKTMERIALSDMDTAAEAKPDQAFETRGGFSWGSATAQSVKPVPVAYRPDSAQIYSGAIGDFVDTDLETMLKSASNAAGRAVIWMGLLGLDLKSRMSGWGQRDEDASATDKAVRQYNINASEKKFLDIINVFEFDAGIVHAMTSYDLHVDQATGEDTAYTSKSGLFMDMETMLIRFGMKLDGKELPDLGGGPRGYWSSVFANICRNPSTMCMVESNS